MIEKIKFAVNGDERGALVALDNKNIPFIIKRVYYIFGTEQNVVRGQHTHKELQQVLVCLKGSCTILLDDGSEKSEVVLDSPDVGLVIKPMIWHNMFNFSPDCVLMAVADEIYDESDYIRSYEDFAVEIVNRKTLKVDRTKQYQSGNLIVNILEVVGDRVTYWAKGWEDSINDRVGRFLENYSAIEK